MAGAGVRRDGARLVFEGALLRDACATLWARARPLAEGADRFDLQGVERIDSAGLALLAELAGHASATAIDGEPEGYAPLCNAYRLDRATLRYAG